MDEKKIFAIGLLGIFIVSLLYVNPYSIFLTGIFGCFVISIQFYTFGRKVDGKRAGLIFTWLLSLWIGGYLFVSGIQEWPSMGGQMGVYAGIFCFVAVWLVYAIVNWLFCKLHNWSARRNQMINKNNK